MGQAKTEQVPSHVWGRRFAYIRDFYFSRWNQARCKLSTFFPPQLAYRDMDPTQINLDDLSRDPVDRLYHCPSCDTPFSRRSNLRRHLIIHTRNMPYRCDICTAAFSRSDQLQYHSLRCTSHSWDELMVWGLLNTLPDSGPSGDLTTDPLSPSLFRPNSVPSSPFPSTQTSSPPSNDMDQAFSDFMSSLAPSSTANTPRLSEPPTSVPSSPIPVFPPTSTPGAGVTNEARSRLQLKRTSRTHEKAVRKKKDSPIYTRRQVEDMLDAVSACFVGTIEKAVGATRMASTAQPPVAAIDRLRPIAAPARVQRRGSESNA